MCAGLCLLPAAIGCNAIRNGWLDPTVVGNFKDTATLEIRTSLTLDDTPTGIPGAVYPSPEDSITRNVEVPIAPGDTLQIEIYELRQRFVPYQAQVPVAPDGDVNLPVVGRLSAAELTVSQFQDSLVQALKDRHILVDPDVTVNPVFLHHATYSIFGIGVSAANNAPLRAGTFPILRPDLRILEAINQVGGLSEFVTDVYVFRYDNPRWMRNGRPEKHKTSEALPPPDREEPETMSVEDEPERKTDALRRLDEEKRAQREALIAAVISGAGITGPAAPPRRPGKPVEEQKASPTQFIWLNGEFVPNPAFRPVTAEEPPPPPSFDTATPPFSWDRIAGDSNYRIIRIPGERLRLGDPESDIVVRGGDVIRIVSGEIGVYYVMGQVNRVGPFAFNAEQITLKAAIAAAGGLTGLAWPDRCTVYRRIGQREQMIQVDLDRVFAGKDPDFLIKRGDIVNVGTHPFAPFLQRIRAMTLPTPINNIGYSFTYARNFADIDSFSVQRNPNNKPGR